jgi:hypothetical protein
MSQNYKFIRDGRSVDKNEINNVPITITINDEEEKDTIYGFDSENKFKNWIKDHHLSNKINAYLAKLEREKMNLNNYNSQRLNQLKTKSEETNKKIEKLSSELNLPVSSIELFKEIERRKIADTTILYDGPGLSGGWRWLNPLYNDLTWSWLNFNDRATSVLISGWTALYEHTNLQGRVHHVAGFPVWVHNDLSSVNFNNITSSCFVYPIGA